MEYLQNLRAFGIKYITLTQKRGFPGGSVVQSPPAYARATGEVGSIPGSGRSPGGGNGNPLQYSSHGQRNLAGYSPQGLKESDMT